MAKKILLGYRTAIGIMDIQGIVDYMNKQEPFQKVILIAAHPLTDAVKNYIEKNLKPLVPVEVIITDNIEEEVRKRDKCCDEIWAINLNDFGNRALSFDAD
jgi:hypothetical protein